MPPPAPSPVTPSVPEPDTPVPDRLPHDNLVGLSLIVPATWEEEVPATWEEEDLPRWRQALQDFSNRANNICFVLTYPFMVVLTLVGLFAVIAFCILPTLLLAIMVVCVYYCLTEDPIPLSVLLRYMLSVDEDEHGHPDHYAMAQNRPVVQKKLIVREVLEVYDKTDDTEVSEELPRRHPFPITIVTEKRVLQYSAPVIFKDEVGNANENGEVAPPPISHAFRPAPPVDEESGIQLTPQATPRSPTVIEQTERDDGKNAVREEESAGEPTSNRLEIPSGSNDEDGDDEVHSTNTFLSDGRLNDRNSDDDGTEASVAMLERLSVEQDAIFLEQKKQGGDGDDQSEVEASVPMDFLQVTIDKFPKNTRQLEPRKQAPPQEKGEEEVKESTREEVEPKQAPQDEEEDLKEPITQEVEPNQEHATQDLEEEEAGKEPAIYDDYFGINEQQDRGTTCDICLLEFEPGDMVAWSPNEECSHCFHKDCILDWLVRKRSCPSCRKDYLKGRKDDNDPSSATRNSLSAGSRRRARLEDANTP